MKNWIQAARLRTLPLSLSGIVVGSFLAAAQKSFDWKICVLALLTTVGFQIVSNFANDYGDGVKGTDNEDRIGPMRALQSGAISPKQMLQAIKITALITLIIALILIYTAFGFENFKYSALFFLLGVASIIAAVKYTMGKKAYGYSGFGDVFVFLFFGLLSVAGSYFLYTKFLNLDIFLPAISIGLFSVAVLNLNNMRDAATDKISNKNTLVVKRGIGFAKKYHFFLILTGMGTLLLYTWIHYKNPIQFLMCIAFLPLLKHLLFVYKNKDSKQLDPELKKVALSTFLMAILFGLGQIL